MINCQTAFLLLNVFSFIFVGAAPHDADLKARTITNIISPSVVTPTGTSRVSIIYPTIIHPRFSFPPVVSPTMIAPTGVYPTAILPPPTASGLSKEFATHKKLFWGAVTDLGDYSSAVESTVLLGNFGSVTPAPTVLTWSAVSIPTFSLALCSIELDPLAGACVHRLSFCVRHELT